MLRALDILDHLTILMKRIREAKNRSNINTRIQGWGAGAECFWLLGAGASWKKKQEPEPLEKKNQEPEPLGKKSEAGAGVGAAKRLPAARR